MDTIELQAYARVGMAQIALENAEWELEYCRNNKPEHYSEWEHVLHHNVEKANEELCACRRYLNAVTGALGVHAKEQALSEFKVLSNISW